MRDTLPERVRLGVFDVDLRAGELRQGDSAICLLPDQPLQILRMLVEADGKIVTREEIQRRLWPDDTVVEFDQSINKAIAKLRRALIDSSDEPRYIQTIAKRGYRLLMPVERIPKSEPNAASGQTEAPAPPAITNGNVPAPVENPRARKWKVGIAIAVVVAGLSGFFYWRQHRRPVLSSKDTIVLADFSNSTGEALFDDTLKQALSIQLEQSPFLKLLSDDKIADTFKLMNRPANQPMTPEIAKEVCLRSNSKALIGGVIALVGDRYLVGLKAKDCRTGDTLASAEGEADNRSRVLQTLSNVSNELRGKLGESLASVQEFNQPLEQVTTSSLEALQAYTRGVTIGMDQSTNSAVPFLKRAVELDPNFAAAYAALARVYKENFEDSLERQYLTRAYELRNHASRRERYSIEADYYGEITGETEKEITTYRNWIDDYPNDYEPHISLANTYRTMGTYDRAVEEGQQAIQLQPDGDAYIFLSDAYLGLNRLDKSKAVLQEALSRGMDGPPLHQHLFVLAFVSGDAATMKTERDWAMGKPGVEALQLLMDSSVEVYHGHLRSARELQARAVESAGRSGAKEMLAYMKIVHGPVEAEIGDPAKARQSVKESLVLLPGKNSDVEGCAALSLAMLGDAKQAQAAVDKLNAEYPLDSMTQAYTLPTVQAVIELKQNHPEKALELLQRTSAHELGNVVMPPNGLYPVYVRGLAYLQLRQGRQAAAEFQKIIDHRGLVAPHLQGALVYLQLGRAQTMMSDYPAARKSYQDFLTLWKDADTDIPLYQHAKAEYAKLSSDGVGHISSLFRSLPQPLAGYLPMKGKRSENSFGGRIHA